MTYASVQQDAIRAGALRSLEHVQDLEATDPGSSASPGTPDELVRCLLRTVAALRDRRFRELVAAVAHGPGVLPPRVRESLVGGEAPEGLAAFAAKVAD